MKPIKILAIQFKYFGDAVILTPALKAIVTQIPNVQLHVLVAAEVAQLLDNLPWITKVWAMPRQRGKVRLLDALPFIQALRRENFDQSIDFGSNDRGALLSYLSGTKNRFGSVDRDDLKLVQRIGYTKIIRRKNPSAPYFDLHFELLQALNVKRPDLLKLEINIENIDIEFMSKIIPNNSILCHISTSQPKKDWPLSHWEKLYKLAHQAGLRLIFSAGPNERERKILAELKLLAPGVEVLPAIEDLKIFLAVLKSLKIFVSGDTGPLHFAEGLGVPVLGIFGVGNSLRQVAPLYSRNEIVCAADCACDILNNSTDTCQVSISCMSIIQPETVFLRLNNILSILNNN